MQQYSPDKKKHSPQLLEEYRRRGELELTQSSIVLAKPQVQEEG